MKLSSTIAGFAVILCAGVAILVVAPRVHAQLYTVVAQSGQQAPGLDSLTFGGFWEIDLNASGQVVFTGELLGPGVDPTNRLALWAGSRGSLQLIVRAGDSATDTGFADAVHRNPYYPSISSDGYVVFIDAFESSQPSGAQGCPNAGIWSGKAGALGLVARVGAIAPSSTLPYGNLHNPLVNQSGRSTFDAWLRDAAAPSNPFGIFSNSSGVTQAVALAGAPAPDVSGAVFGDSHPQFSADDAGDVAFIWNLSGPGMGPANDLGIWMGPASAPRIIARTGAAAPGTSDTFTGLSTPILSRLGQVAFTASLSDSAPAVNGSIWLSSPSGLHLAAVAGQQAPGTPPEVVFATFHIAYPADNGQISFVAGLTGESVHSANDVGIWAGPADSLRLIARTGDAVPGIPDAVFANFDQYRGNSLGQICFIGRIEGPGIDGSNDTGIWATDLAGNLVALLRGGQEIDLGGGDIRTLLPMNSDSFALIFNDAGQTAYSATFTDGTTALLLVTVPEPIGVLWCVLGLMALRRRRTAGQGQR